MRLFENLPNHNPQGELETEADFLVESAITL
jgi:hypothetical protein